MSDVVKGNFKREIRKEKRRCINTIRDRFKISIIFVLKKYLIKYIE